MKLITLPIESVALKASMGLATHTYVHMVSVNRQQTGPELKTHRVDSVTVVFN